MKKIVLAGMGLLAIAILPAAAADLPARPVYKAPVAMPLFNWTGFYVGINGGYSWGRTDTSVTGLTPGGAVNFGVRPDGWLGGGQMGYNWQGAGSPWVFGLETDFQATGEIADSTCSAPTCVPNAIVKTNYPYFGTFRGRVGYDVDRWLLYITGGLGYAEVRRQVNQLGVVSFADTQWRIGWVAGAGIEYAFAEHWSVKTEYLYLDYGNGSVAVPASGPLGAAPLGAIGISTHWTDNVVRGGINYRF